MARRPRLVIPGALHLVLHRGQGVRPVFEGAEPRERYVAALRDAARDAGVAIHAYGLHDHELRLLATPSDPAGLARTIQSVDRRCVPDLNRRRGAVGSPWAGRFRSAVVDADHCFGECLRHVELDAPLEAGEPGPTLAWSSARHHFGVEASPWIAAHRGFWRFGNTPFEREAAYRRFAEGEAGEAMAAILRAAAHGWPVGAPEFARALQEASGQRAVPLEAGRPRRQASQRPE